MNKCTKAHYELISELPGIISSRKSNPKTGYWHEDLYLNHKRVAVAYGGGLSGTEHYGCIRSLHG